MIKGRNPMLSGAQDRNGWFTSSFSSNANQCVEVRFDGEFVSIRDSKYRRNPTNQPAREPIITVTAAHWTVLLHQLAGRQAERAEVSADGAREALHERRALRQD